MGNAEPSIVILMSACNQELDGIRAFRMRRDQGRPFDLPGVVAGEVHGTFSEVEFVEELDAEVAVVGVGDWHFGFGEGNRFECDGAEREKESSYVDSRGVFIDDSESSV